MSLKLLRPPDKNSFQLFQFFSRPLSAPAAPQRRSRQRYLPSCYQPFKKTFAPGHTAGLRALIHWTLIHFVTNDWALSFEMVARAFKKVFDTCFSIKAPKRPFLGSFF